MENIDYLKKYYQGDIEEAIKRLNNGEAIQYIVGNVDFYGLNFKVNKNVLIPRFETEELIEKLINYSKNYFDEKLDIVDIGTGSGCIAITLNKNLNCSVDAVDISDDALTVARENAIKNDADVNFINGNIMDKLNRRYDIIISNPPYIAYDEEIMDVVKNNEPNIALYAKNNGLYFYQEILKNAHNYLKDKYIIAFEIGKTQGSQIKCLAEAYLNPGRVIIEKDLTGVDRFVFIFSE